MFSFVSPLLFSLSAEWDCLKLTTPPFEDVCCNELFSQVSEVSAVHQAKQSPHPVTIGPHAEQGSCPARSGPTALRSWRLIPFPQEGSLSETWDPTRGNIWNAGLAWDLMSWSLAAKV